MRTLLIDSGQVESGEAISKEFRDAAGDEIERFRKEIIQRTGDQQAAAKISDEDLLREVMNAVGKKGQLGEGIRCVISVSMLTEGWGARSARPRTCFRIPRVWRSGRYGRYGRYGSRLRNQRHLLYVACTRARDRLMVSGVEPGSEFLADLR